MAIQTDAAVVPGTDSIPPTPSNENAAATVVLEDYLEKQGSRSQNFWHERYFKLNADGNLRYYSKKGDAKAKTTLNLNKLPDCEIGDLYITRHKGQMLYCVKITWAVESTGPSEADNESVFSGGGATVLALPGDDNDDANASQHDQVAPEEPKKKKRGIFRKGKSKSASQQHITKSRSRDEPSTPNSSVVLRSPSSKKGQVSLRGVDGEPSRLRQIPTLSSSADNDDVPKIPAIVEVEDDGHEIPTPKQDDDTTLTTTNRFVSNNQAAAMDGETESQMEQLHSKFLSVEKQNKKKAKQKIADGAKYAAVTGAAVGVAVVTVGIGLVAGLAAVAVGTAAGGSTMAAVPLWKKKRDGVIVIGSTDYDTMRSWKACLDAALNSGIIQKSKWGQQFVGDGNRKALIFPKGNDPFQNREVNVGSPPPSPDAGSAAGIFF
mmetsp:Transcript_20008/g.47802  ORF Transcript_20008/g.47802 Transcript_20008/m.47802 type:complete len:434 (-) Transcript_20008:21-1322(-)